MTDELEELKRRQDELEEFVNVLESRLQYAGDPDEDRRCCGYADDAKRYPGGESFIALHQSFHGTHLKRVEWEQKGLKRSMENAVGKLSTIEETLRRVDRIVQGLAERGEGC
jgi:hypothetical protein